MHARVRAAPGLEAAQAQRITVTDIGEFVRHKACQVRFKLSLNKRAIPRGLPFFGRLFNPLDPELKRFGALKEEQFREYLARQRLTEPELQRGERGEAPLDSVFDALGRGEPGRSYFFREIAVSGTIGAFLVEGRMDYLLFIREAEGVRIRIVEVKASRRDQTYHRIQVATYAILLRAYLADEAIQIGPDSVRIVGLEAVVARLDEMTGVLQPVLQLPPLTLDVELSDVRRLLSPNGVLDQIVRADLAALPYQIDPKCDGCVFNVYCLPESGRNRRLQLTGIDIATIRALASAGVNNIDELATLDFASPAAERVRGHHGFSKNLMRLVQEARIRRVTLPRVAMPRAADAARDARHLATAQRLFAEYRTANIAISDVDYFQWVQEIRERKAASTLSRELETALAAANFPWAPEVARLPSVKPAQLPSYEIGNRPLVRVYLSIHFDYIEHRIGAIAAHITSGSFGIETPFRDIQTAQGVRRGPDPIVVESQWEEDAATGQRRKVNTRPVQGPVVVKYKTGPWSTVAEDANASERELLQDFFHELINALALFSQAEDAMIHFYVWSRSEISRLVEACARTSSDLLASLRELLGCREPLEAEQLIFSAIGDEVDRQFGLGWTGRGLVVVSSLRWPGRFHWTRQIGRDLVPLDWVFRQDIFDFKTRLSVNAEGEWCEDDEAGATKHTFEIRSRYFDSLSAPYWRAVWQTLKRPQEGDGTPALERNQIERYYEASHPNYLKEYLTARTQAMRWIEERCRKNAEIVKRPVNIRNLVNFRLGVDDTARAAIDFLRLDHYVKRTEWITERLDPPSARVPAGKTIPLRNVRAIGGRRLVADIRVDEFRVQLQTLMARCSYGAGSFVRVSKCFDDPDAGQTIAMLTRAATTCIVEDIDWRNGRITLDVVPHQDAPYLLPNWFWREGEAPWDRAMLDESPMDFVARRVDQKLTRTPQSHVYQWLDPVRPRIPPIAALPAARATAIQGALSEVELPNQGRLMADQVEAVVAGITHRISQLQGPPGTGKTTTLAAAVLARIAARHTPGAIVLIGANTHTAVDTVLLKTVEVLEPLRGAFAARGVLLPPITLIRIGDDGGGLPNPIIAIPDERDAPERVVEARRGSVVIVAGTTNALLKLDDNWAKSAKQRRDRGAFAAADLIVDEASMMVFPHFLSLATLASDQGQLFVAGDHRQLAPIISHDWEHEERPPVLIYQPYASAFESLNRLHDRIVERHGVAERQGRISRVALSYSHRLPAILRQLIAPLYRRDEIELDGRADEPVADAVDADNAPWRSVWRPNVRLVQVVHANAVSTRSNQCEVEAIVEILRHAPGHARDGIAIVTPHRAQKAMLADRLAQAGFGNVPVDTVERFQGGERPYIIVSATVSDPAAIAQRAEFILNANRANVAFSRARQKLIVVCGQTLLDAVPSDLEDYESSILWKALRELCTVELAATNIGGDAVSIRAPNLPLLRAQVEE